MSTPSRVGALLIFAASAWACPRGGLQSCISGLCQELAGFKNDLFDDCVSGCIENCARQGRALQDYKLKPLQSQCLMGQVTDNAETLGELVKDCNCKEMSDKIGTLERSDFVKNVDFEELVVGLIERFSPSVAPAIPTAPPTVPGTPEEGDHGCNDGNHALNNVNKIVHNGHLDCDCTHSCKQSNFLCVGECTASCVAHHPCQNSRWIGNWTVTCGSDWACVGSCGYEGATFTDGRANDADCYFNSPFSGEPAAIPDEFHLHYDGAIDEDNIHSPTNPPTNPPTESPVPDNHVLCQDEGGNHVFNSRKVTVENGAHLNCDCTHSCKSSNIVCNDGNHGKCTASCDAHHPCQNSRWIGQWEVHCGSDWACVGSCGFNGASFSSGRASDANCQFDSPFSGEPPKWDGSINLQSPHVPTPPPTLSPTESPIPDHYEHCEDEQGYGSWNGKNPHVVASGKHLACDCTHACKQANFVCNDGQHGSCTASCDAHHPCQNSRWIGQWTVTCGSDWACVGSCGYNGATFSGGRSGDADCQFNSPFATKPPDFNYNGIPLNSPHVG